MYARVNNITAGADLMLVQQTVYFLITIIYLEVSSIDGSFVTTEILMRGRAL